jgi:hypothetical protein
MGHRWRKLGILAAGLLAAGAARLPVEAEWTAQFRGAGLLRQGVAADTRAKIGQTFYAVALGGLRTLVATFFNLRALGFYEDRDWDRMHETFETMVALAPRTGEYWTSGAHHQAMNAASYYRNDEFLDLPPLRREALWRASVRRGREFAERGTRQVPDDWKLHAFLGFLLTDRYRYSAFGDLDETFAAAASEYRAAADCPGSLPYLRRFELYALARVKTRKGEALELARSLYANPANRTPTLRRVSFALEMWAQPTTTDPVTLAVERFGSAPAAYRELGDYWQHGAACLPMDGVALTLRKLEQQLAIPDTNSVLRRTPDQPRGGLDQGREE